ncbi:MAG: hypothetical protein ACOC80_16640 [Petrotogales bacterium]
MDEDGCEFGRHMDDKVKNLADEIEGISGRLDEINNKLDKLKNRLPLWATIGFAACGTLIGAMATIIAEMI